MNKYIKHFSFFLNLLLFYFLFTNKIFAYYEENFNTNYSDISYWEVNQNSGTLSFSDIPDYLKFSSNNNKFPFLKTVKNIIPEGNFEIKIKFQYLQNSSDFGNGIVLSDLAPFNGGNLGSEHGIIAIWQDKTDKLRIETPLCSFDNPGCSGTARIFQTSSLDFHDHIVKYSYINGIYKIYFDNILKFTSSYTDRRPSNFWLGNPRFLSEAQDWSSFAIDYIKIKKLPDKVLDVPFYSQNDEDWGEDIYDHIGKTIDQVGCAMTSAAMIFRYYGMDYIPYTNEELTPKTLNNWLISKPVHAEGIYGNSAGYTSEGGVSWIALNQLARFYNPFYSLEIMTGSLDSSDGDFKTFKEHIDEGRPEIFWIQNGVNYWDNWDTHFVVGKGYDSENVYLNDPEKPQNGHDKVPLTYNFSRRFAFFVDPDWKDWGKLQWHVNKKLSALVEDSQGNKLGKDLKGNFYDEIENGYYLEGEMMGSEGSNDSVNIYLSKVATDSAYKITVFGDENEDFSLSMQSLNTDNKSYESSSSAVVNNTGEIEFTANFSDDENNSLEEIIEEEPVTYDSIKQYIKEEYQKGNIKSYIVKKLLLNYLRISERFYEKGRIRLAKLFINHEIRFLGRLRKWFIESETKKELIEMLDKLKENL